jgi:hypothetical protein
MIIVHLQRQMSFLIAIIAQRRAYERHFDKP